MSRSPVGQLGVSAAFSPALADEFANLGSGQGANILPLLHRFDRGSRMDAEGSQLTNMEVRGAVEGAWDKGLNSLLICNYNTPKGVKTKQPPALAIRMFR